MTRALAHAIRIQANRLFAWLADPADASMYKRLGRVLLHLSPPVRGLLLYRQGHLRRALGGLRLAPKGNAFLRRVHARVEHMLDVLDTGWRLPKARSDEGKASDGVIMALHNSLPHDAAGYAVRSHEVLRNLDSYGWRVHAVTRPGYPMDLASHRGLLADESDMVGKVLYTRLPLAKTGIGGVESDYVTTYAELLKEQARANRAGIVHAASNYLNGLAAVTAARQAGLRSIYEMRGLWHMSRAAREPYFQNSDHYRYCHSCELTAAMGADAVVTISTPLKELLVQEGVPAERVTVIPNAVDASRFHAMAPDEKLKQELGLDGAFVVGFIGSLTQYEGIDLMLRAVDALAAQGKPVAALVVGRGYAEPRLRKLAANLARPERLVFTGFIPNAEVERYYSIVDAFPFPRLDIPVCNLVPPLKILEAMAMEKAVLVSALPPLLEFIRLGETGLSFPAGDVEALANCLRRLIDAPDEAHAMGRRARAWVLAHRNWPDVAGRYDALYGDLLGLPCRSHSSGRIK